MEPVSLSLAVISLVGTVVLAIINLFKSPFNCQGLKSDCLKSSCCIIENEGDINVEGDKNHIRK